MVFEKDTQRRVPYNIIKFPGSERRIDAFSESLHGVEGFRDDFHYMETAGDPGLKHIGGLPLIH